MQKQKSTVPAMICAALGNGIFGFSFVFSANALDVTQPFVMLMYRFIIAFAVILAVALTARRFRKPVTAEGADIDWLRFELKGRSVLPLLGMGVIQPVAYFLCESYGIQMTNATLAGVMIALIPIVAIISGAFVLHEIPRVRQIIFLLLSIAGVIVMTLQQQSGGQVQWWGVVLLLGAVFAGAYFNVLSRKISTQYSAMERTTVMMGVAALTFTVLAIVTTHGDIQLLTAPLRSSKFLVAMLYLSICSSIIAFMSLNIANNDLPIAKSTAFENLTTIISLIAGVLFRGDVFDPVISLLASAMIVIGIWGAQRS